MYILRGLFFGIDFNVLSNEAYTFFLSKKDKKIEK